MTTEEFTKQAEFIGDGNRCSCCIDGTDISDARLHKENGKWYICQNEKEGCDCTNKLGYKYSWIVSCQAEASIISNLQPVFKKGDVVKNRETGAIDVVESVPGMKEYDCNGFASANEGMVLERYLWKFQKHWIGVPEKEAEEPTVPEEKAIMDVINEQVQRILLGGTSTKYCGKAPQPKKGVRYMLSTLAKKLLDADVKALVEVGWLDSELDVTEEGENAVLAFLVETNKAELAKRAQKELKERKERK